MSFSTELDEILKNVEDWHGFRDEAIANLPEFTRQFVDDASWAGEELKAERLRLAKAAIIELVKRETAEAVREAKEGHWHTEIDSKLLRAIEVSGNEFAMGYSDSGCFWRFYAGKRGAGSMIGDPVFQSESPEVCEALDEYLTQSTKEEE